MASRVRQLVVAGLNHHSPSTRYSLLAIRFFRSLPRMLAHGIAEGAEDAGRGGVGPDPVFGMPLDADGKGGRIADGNRLDGAVVRHGLDAKPRAEPVDALAMHRV